MFLSETRNMYKDICVKKGYYRVVVLPMRTQTKQLAWLFALLAVLSAPNPASAYYHPGVQRWISRDPVGLAQSLYLVCENETINRIDPNGLKWRTGGPQNPNSTQPTIVCDGKGGIRIWYPPSWPPNTDPCVKGCLDDHENCHAKDALASNPDICKGKPAGTTIHAGAVFSREWKASEEKCRRLEMICLKQNIVGCPSKCDAQAVTDRLNQLRRARYPE
jgi:hypothetical protein